jgi:pimeloyl-ACP methyl ester carboxylesterase
LPAETQNPEKKIATGNENTADTRTRVEEHWLQLRDGRMRYLKAGSGRPLILVHGLMGYSFSWRFTMPALAAHATVYAVDNLGAGLSNANEGMDCTMRGTAERLLQFADALGIGEFDLLGTSHGGGVAIMVTALSAERNGSSLRRLVLVAPVNPWSAHGKWLAPFLGSRFGSVLFRNTIQEWRGLDSFWLSRMFGDKAKIPSDSLEGYRMPVLKNNAMLHGSRIVRSWTADLAELERVLPSIRDSHTLLMWGTGDRAVLFESAERLRSNFRGGRLVTFDGVGHLPYEEAPEEFNSALIDFLTHP